MPGTEQETPAQGGRQCQRDVRVGEAAKRWLDVLRRLGDNVSKPACWRQAAGSSLRAIRECAEATISRRMSRDPERMRRAVEHAELASTKRDWQEAVKRWQEVVDHFGTNQADFAHVRLSVAYRFLGQYAEAESVAAQGIERYPQSMGCRVEHAEVASTKKDWAEAVTRWQGVLDRFGSGAPDLAYVRLATSYRSTARHDEAEAIIERGLQRYPHSVRCLAEAAELATARGDWGEATRRWQCVLDRHLRRCPQAARNQVLGNVQRLNRSRPAQFAAFARYVLSQLDPLTLRLCAKLDDCHAALEVHDADAAIRGFEQVLAAEGQALPRDVWVASYSKLARFICDEPSLGEDPSPVQDQVRDIARTMPVKLCVGGTGWSGSGAIYDYFKEFHQVVPTDRFGELHYMEGPYGLGLRSKQRDFKRYLLSLYTTALLGLPRLVDIRDQYTVKAALRARAFAFGPNAKAVAEAVDELVAGLVDARGRGPHEQECFSRVTSRFIDKILLVETKVAEGYLLLDNIVHCQNVSMIGSLSAVQYFASLRDPRSQYVANVRERSGGSVTLEGFIRGYRSNVSAFLKSKAQVDSASSAVHVVGFERFVLDEAYRDGLAKSVGLDLQQRIKHRHFRPWESEKNVYIHETYPRQDEIRLIEKRLPEFCVDLKRLSDASPARQPIRRVSC